jgi:hypothetical protein
MQPVEFALSFLLFWVWATDSGLIASTLPILLAVCRI